MKFVLNFPEIIVPTVLEFLNINEDISERWKNLVD